MDVNNRVNRDELKVKKPFFTPMEEVTKPIREFGVKNDSEVSRIFLRLNFEILSFFFFVLYNLGKHFNQWSPLE